MTTRLESLSALLAFIWALACVYTVVYLEVTWKVELLETCTAFVLLLGEVTIFRVLARNMFPEGIGVGK